MAGMTVEQLEFLASKGLTLEETIEFAKLGAKRSSGAIRQARWREKQKGRDVTGNVTRDASPPPIDNIHTPPVSSDEETRPARKAKVPKPGDVTDQTWTDFLEHRKAKKAPITASALAGIRREAEKAGWLMEAALVEAMARGWQGFNAEWVAAARAPPAEPTSLVDQILERRRRTVEHSP